jgi:hypothetical protein
LRSRPRPVSFKDSSFWPIACSSLSTSASLAAGRGKLTIVLLLLTLIERALLEARPAFFIVAGMAKSGKTTLAQMCSMAIFGTVAPGANWSDNEEERRKALFSFFRQGVPCVLWDNIKRGAAISCPHIERSLTEPKMSDRVLGNSNVETVPTNTVQIFTGNRIWPRATWRAGL